MLHYKTIDPTALELLNKIQSKSIFSELRLVGGTALAMQIGHRKSIDLDFFGTLNADELEITTTLNEIGEIRTLKKSKNINIYTINGVKVDIINYPYQWIDKPVVDNQLKLGGLADIAAMKMAAITGRGTKKDFIDIYFLLKYLTLRQILDLYAKKYPDGSEFLVLKSLTYFEDAESDEEPIMLSPTDWFTVKNDIRQKIINLKT